MFFWVGIIISQTYSQVFYHFGKSFGQIYRDRLYSSSLVAVNGLDSTTLDYDVMPTDRGVYLPLIDYGITIYPNDISPNPVLISGAFTASLWAKIISTYDSMIFRRLMNSGDSLYVWCNIDQNTCQMTLDYKTLHHSVIVAIDIFSLASWNLFGIRIDLDKISFYINASPFINIQLSEVYTETAVEFYTLGSLSCCYGMEGFLWYYHHTYNVSSFSNMIENSASSNCFYPGCDICIVSIVDPIFQKVGCVLDSSDPSLSSCSESCQSGCLNGTCVSCNCAYQSCFFYSSQTFCDCPLANISISENCLICSNACLKCIDPYTCLICKDTNASPKDGSCVCNGGFYESSSLNEGGMCLKCNKQCINCSISHCESCVALNAQPNDNFGCSCNQGYYPENLLMNTTDSCKLCNNNCSTCNNSLTCISCKNEETFADESGTCRCLSGFYQQENIENMTCLKCSENCNECSSFGTCTSCSKNNTELLGGICKCLPGYYEGDAAGNKTCLKCRNDCAECISFDNCSRCGENHSELVEGRCICLSGFFYEGQSENSTCVKCKEICKECSSVDLCTSCSISNSEVFEGECRCIEGYYFNGELLCESCPYGCSKCSLVEEKIFCDHCVEGFELSLGNCQKCPPYYKECPEKTQCSYSENGFEPNDPECTCKPGYTLKDLYCIRNILTIKSWISKENIVKLIFSEPLSEDLNYSDLKVSIEESLITFKLSKDDSKTYSIQPKISKVTSSFSIKIEILRNLTSTNQSLFLAEIFTHPLIYSSDSQKQEKIAEKAKAAKEFSEKGTTAGISISLILSFLNFDPSSIFSFLNTAEMFYALHFFELELNPVFSEFLIGMRIQKKIPNFLENFIDSSDFSEIPEKYQKIGYKSHIFIINLWMQIITFAVFGVLWFVLFVLLKFITNFKLLEKLYDLLTFSAFLRLWLQNFFEVLLASGLSLLYLDGGIKIFDTVICLIFLIIVVLMIFLQFLVIFRRATLTNQDKLNEIKRKYGTFFDDFKEEGLVSCLFYVFFILKRLILFLCLKFIRDGILQLSICIGISFILCFYIVYSRCFKLRVLNFYHFFNETLITTVYIITFISFLVKESKYSTAYSSICMTLITVTWGLNIGNSLYKFIQKFYEYLQNRRKKHIKIANVLEVTKVTEIPVFNNQKINLE